MKTLISIALCADFHVRYFTAACIASVLVNAAPSDSFVFHVLTQGYPEKDKDVLRRLAADRGARITIYDMLPEHLRAIPDPVFQYPKSAFFRLFLTEYIHDCGRILYLDVDTTALTSLAPLFHIDLQGSCFAAVPDTGRDSDWLRRQAALIGLTGQYSSEFPYFNTGVLLIDLKQWREQQVLARGLALAATHAAVITCADQDILNILYANNYTILEQKWNIKQRDYNILKQKWNIQNIDGHIPDDIAIFHCTGEYRNKFSTKETLFFLFYILFTEYRVFQLSSVYSSGGDISVSGVLSRIFSRHTEKLREDIENLRGTALEKSGVIEMYVKNFTAAYAEYCSTLLFGKEAYFFGYGAMYENTKGFFAGTRPLAMLVTDYDRYAPAARIDGLSVVAFTSVPQRELLEHPTVVFVNPQYVEAIARAFAKCRIPTENIVFAFPFSLFG